MVSAPSESVLISTEGEGKERASFVFSADRGGHTAFSFSNRLYFV